MGGGGGKTEHRESWGGALNSAQQSPFRGSGFEISKGGGGGGGGGVKRYQAPQKKP